MKLTDTHTHLFLEHFKNDRDEVMQNAISRDIDKMILPNVDASTIDDLEQLVNKYPKNCFPAMGLHPGSVKENYQEELETIVKKLSEKSYIAVGEIGIDLYWDQSFKKEQIEVFDFQLKLAADLDLPVIIHTRDSFPEVYKTVKQNAELGLKGVFHSFTGNKEQAQMIFDLGFYIGINGIVTFKNSGLDEIVADLPIEKILLETDAPYLTPAPYRGKRNEAAYLVLIAEKIASVKRLSIEKVAEVTTQNASDLFSI